MQTLRWRRCARRPDQVRRVRASFTRTWNCSRGLRLVVRSGICNVASAVRYCSHCDNPTPLGFRMRCCDSCRIARRLATFVKHNAKRPPRRPLTTNGSFSGPKGQPLEMLACYCGRIVRAAGILGHISRKHRLSAKALRILHPALWARASRYRAPVAVRQSASNRMHLAHHKRRAEKAAKLLASYGRRPTHSLRKHAAR